MVYKWHTAAKKSGAGDAVDAASLSLALCPSHYLSIGLRALGRGILAPASTRADHAHAATLPVARWWAHTDSEPRGLREINPTQHYWPHLAAHMSVCPAFHPSACPLPRHLSLSFSCLLFYLLPCIFSHVHSPVVHFLYFSPFILFITLSYFQPLLNPLSFFPPPCLTSYPFSLLASLSIHLFL